MTVGVNSIAYNYISVTDDTLNWLGFAQWGTWIFQFCELKFIFTYGIISVVFTFSAFGDGGKTPQ